MSHFYERVLNVEINYLEETNKLASIFENEKFHTNAYYGQISAAVYIDNAFFRQLELSGNYISLFGLLSDIRNETPERAFVEYSELVLSLSRQLFGKDYYSLGDKDLIEDKLGNAIKVICFDLDKLNLKYEFIKTNAGDVAIILPKDELLESVLEDIDDNNLIRKLIEYKSIRMDGNVDGKESLLYAFGKYVEPILKEPQLKQMNNRLFDDVGFMLNNLDLRHNNIDANVKKYYKATLSKREEWLDKLYTDILLVIKSKNEKDIHCSISNLKANVT